MIIKGTPVMDPIPMGSEPPDRDWVWAFAAVVVAFVVASYFGGCVT